MEASPPNIPRREEEKGGGEPRSPSSGLLFAVCGNYQINIFFFPQAARALLFFSPNDF